MSAILAGYSWFDLVSPDESWQNVFKLNPYAQSHKGHIATNRIQRQLWMVSMDVEGQVHDLLEGAILKFTHTQDKW